MKKIDCGLPYVNHDGSNNTINIETWKIHDTVGGGVVIIFAPDSFFSFITHFAAQINQLYDVKKKKGKISPFAPKINQLYDVRIKKKGKISPFAAKINQLYDVKIKKKGKPF